MPMYMPAPSTIVLGYQNIAVSKTDADTSEATLYSLTIPAGAMGPSDHLRVTSRWQYPSSATVKSLRARLGGTEMARSDNTTTVSNVLQIPITNLGSLSSQIGSNGNVGVGNSGSAFYTGAVDMTQAQTLTLTAQWGSAAGGGANSITLRTVFVELLRVS